MILSAADFELLPGVIGIDAPAFEAIATLSAEDFDIVPVPFEVIAVSPELEAPNLEFILAPMWEPAIAAEAADGGARGGGRAIPLWQLLAEEPEAANDDLEEEDDILALTLILALAA